MGKILLILYHFIYKISMGNKCCKNDSKLEGYPKTDEEKRTMKRPFVAATAPKRYRSPYSAWIFNPEKSTIGAHVDCPRTSPSVTAPTKALHTSLSHSWPPRRKTISVCASKPTTSRTATALTISSTSELDPSSISTYPNIKLENCSDFSKFLTILN